MLFFEILLIILVLVINALHIHASAYNRPITCNPCNLECYIRVKEDFGEPHQPLVLVNNNGWTDFAYPRADRNTIVIEHCRHIEIYCPGGHVLQNRTPLFVDSIQLTCNNGTLERNDRTVYFNSITCSKEAKRDVIYNNTNTDYYVNFEIGYNHTNNFIPLISGYFNKSAESTEYTTHIIPKAILGHQVCDRSSWAKGPFFKGIDIDAVYKRDAQRRTINKQLGLTIDSTKYVPKTGQHYLSRGHLAPKADFMYGSQQSATFYFVNAIPQWQMCNNRNWKILESNIQTLAARREKNLRIFTGTFRVMKLRNEINRSLTELYLYPNSGRNLVPIPEFIWKIVYEEDSQAGVGFVVVNNPYADWPDNYICNTICTNLDYISFNPTNKECGYVYCCEVNDMRQVIHNIPNLQVNSLLRSVDGYISR